MHRAYYMRVDIEPRDVVTKQSILNATVDHDNIFNKMKYKFMPSKDLFELTGASIDQDTRMPIYYFFA